MDTGDGYGDKVVYSFRQIVGVANKLENSVKGLDITKKKTQKTDNWVDTNRVADICLFRMWALISR